MRWDWKTRAEEVERARLAYPDQVTPGHWERVERFRQVLAEAWPPHFFEDLERCKRGEAGGLDAVLEFVEVFPRFYSTGYVLTKALRWLGRPPRTPEQAARIQAIVLASVHRRNRLPFLRMPALGRAVDSPELRAELRRVVDNDPDFRVRERAMRVLDGLPPPPGDRERARQLRCDQLLEQWYTLAHTTFEPEAIRSALAFEPRNLTYRGRKLQAVVFEWVMNRALLPDEELLAIARLIDGLAMEEIWSYALERTDAPGDRARWLLARLPGRTGK